jgi:acetyl esterase
MNPQVQTALDVSARLAASAPPSADPLEAARNAYRQLVPLAGSQEPVHSVRDQLIQADEHRIPVRIYNPYGGTALPAILFFHGGWFIAGDLDTHDRPLRALANASGCVVVAVDYRLAPEYPFPAAIDDGRLVLKWLASKGAAFGIDPNRLIIAGDSAGGNIATVLARKATGMKGLKVLLQVLIYPVTDPSLASASWKQFANGPVITLDTALRAWQMYVPASTDRQNADAAPILANDLAGNPKALVIVAENDPLHDEGIAYAARLKNAGVSVTTITYKGMPHGFFQMAGYLDEGRQVMEEIASVVNDTLSN